MNMIIKGEVYRRVGPWIYVACLAAYNNGKLHGAWINAASDIDWIREEIKDMLKTSPEPDAEEWAIHGYEGFEGIRLDEWHDIREVNDIAIALDEIDNASLLAQVYNALNDSIENAKEFIEENYQGCHKNIEEWAYQFLEDTGGLEGVPAHLESYIDFAAYARDAKLNGEILTIETGHNEVHVFLNS
jgi:antirestriction protein